MQLHIKNMYIQSKFYVFKKEKDRFWQYKAMSQTMSHLCIVMAPVAGEDMWEKKVHTVALIVFKKD